MTTFKIRIIREEIYSAVVSVDAESPELAIANAQKTLDHEGWDALCDYDGDYCECDSHVESVDCPTCSVAFVPNKTMCKCERTPKR